MSEQKDSYQTPLCVNLQILRASHTVLKMYDDAYRTFGIRATQVPVLSLIGAFGPLTIKKIAQETSSERSVLSRKLQVMEKNGWIKESSDPTEREKVFVITEAGEHLLEQVGPVRLQVQTALMSKLSPEEQSLMLSLCNKLKE